ncbi:hypothetical protein [Cellulomonas humilata]|uniref:Uncharacterized protein n=1 Tax=Cellulomonas humilata TaxID=144055 RepID=A0ABU0EKX8_9CELL|nr:hypothetical protein [Cellulomonas humilata]MDQ0375941.1 hypothetical protein [Cellulomonas humilata]
MNVSTDRADAVLTKALRAAAEAFLAALDEGAGAIANAATDDGEPAEYDPLHDAPLFTPNPQKSATEAQQQMAWITYLGAIGRLNAEEGRGANAKEISEFAKKAGYMGGNAVNGWNSRPGSPRAVEVVDGARFLNDGALGWIEKDAAKLGIRLVGEFSTVPRPE